MSAFTKEIHWKCPMRGLRAPEVCAGELMGRVQSVLDFPNCEFLMRRTAHLQAEDRDKLVLDWTCVKSSVLLQLELKLSPYTCLPLCTLGIGHWSETKARKLCGRL